jgi:K+-transporting ATPase KdpF subunit
VTAVEIVALAVGVALLVYLVVSLLRAEDF